MELCKSIIAPDLSQLLLSSQRNRNTGAVLQEAFLFRKVCYIVEIDKDSAADQKKVVPGIERLYK